MGVSFHSLQKTLYILIFCIIGVYLLIFWVMHKVRSGSKERKAEKTFAFRRKFLYYVIYLLLAYGLLFIVLQRTMLK